MVCTSVQCAVCVCVCVVSDWGYAVYLFEPISGMLGLVSRHRNMFKHDQPLDS